MKISKETQERNEKMIDRAFNLIVKLSSRVEVLERKLGVPIDEDWYITEKKQEE
jgi:hypothetical protein